MSDELTSYSITPFAGYTGVEPAPYAVTGRHLNRLTYTLSIAGAEGLEPSTFGFGDRRSSN